MTLHFFSVIVKLRSVCANSPVRVAHVGIAVASIDAALPFYRDILGLVPGAPEIADGATIVSLTLGDVQVELLEPETPTAPSPDSSPIVDRGSTTSATASPISTAPSKTAAPQVTALWIKRPVAVRPAAASPFSTPRRPPAFCSS